MKYVSADEFVRQIGIMNNRYRVEIYAAKNSMGALAVQHFKSSFDKGGFAGSENQWTERRKNYRHPILNRTGRLKNSIKFLAPSATSRITVFTDVPYSQYHNDPTGTWRRNQFTDLPATQRKFMGNSTVLELKMKAIIERAIRNTLRMAL